MKKRKIKRPGNSEILNQEKIIRNPGKNEDYHDQNGLELIKSVSDESTKGTRNHEKENPVNPVKDIMKRSNPEIYAKNSRGNA